MEPDQTATTGAVWSGSTLFVEEASKTLHVYQTTKADDLCCISAQIGYVFHEMHARLSGSNNLSTMLTLTLPGADLI